MVTKNKGINAAYAKKRAEMRKHPQYGKISDGEMAKIFGVSSHFVRTARYKDGTPGVGVGGKHHQRRKEMAVDPELRTHTIAYLAKKYNCGEGLISVVRRDHGIQKKLVRGWKPQSDIWVAIDKECTANQKLFTTWTRPKGIDSLLEQIRE